MNIQDAKLRAEVDWIELRFELERSTNFATLYKRGEGYIKAFSKTDTGLRRVGNTGSNVFSVRIQNPGSVAGIERALVKISEGNRIIGVPAVVGLELALDVYSVYQNDNALPDFAYTMFQFGTKFASDNRRFTGTRGMKNALPIPDSAAQVKNLLNEGRGIFIGDKGADVHQRFYVKRTDNNQQLPVEEHRARYEVTFNNSAVPVRTLDELRTFKFESLTEWFCFTKLREGALDPSRPFHALREKAFTMDTRPGEKRERLTPKGKRLHASSVQRDTALNEKSADALRGLSRRWKKTKDQRKIRQLEAPKPASYQDFGLFA